jgi:hypothetical protein
VQPLQVCSPPVLPSLAYWPLTICWWLLLLLLLLLHKLACLRRIQGRNDWLVLACRHIIGSGCCGWGQLPLLRVPSHYSGILPLPTLLPLLLLLPLLMLMLLVA